VCCYAACGGPTKINGVEDVPPIARLLVRVDEVWPTHGYNDPMPWVRKTDSTIKQELADKRWSPWLSMLVFFIFLIIGSVVVNHDGSKLSRLFDLSGGPVEVLIFPTLFAMGIPNAP